MWDKLYKLVEHYDCWHKWVKIKTDGRITYYRCTKCGNVKETYFD